MTIQTITDVRQWIAERYELDDTQVDEVARFVWANVQHPITEDVLHDFGDAIDAIVVSCAIVSAA